MPLQQHLPVSPPNSKFFLHNVKVDKVRKAKFSDIAAK